MKNNEEKDLKKCKLYTTRSTSSVTEAVSNIIISFCASDKDAEKFPVSLMFGKNKTLLHASKQHLDGIA